MARVHCFTSATFAYLDRATVLAETLRQHQPDWHLTLLLCDEAPDGVVLDAPGPFFDAVVHLSDLGIPDLRRWMFGHDLVELCTAVKGAMLLRLLQGGAQKVVYLDPDIALLADLGPIEALLDQHSILLTPHQLRPDTTLPAIWDNEVGSLQHGIYNLGFLAVANTGEGLRFAAWWRDRLLHFCRDDVPAGLFTDQRWCDHVPAFFGGVHILRDPGCNVASWNLSQRPLTFDTEGTLRADGQVLRFFHFTKVFSIGEAMLDRYAADRIELFELLHWYRRRVLFHRSDAVPGGWWAYGQFGDGTPIQPAHRRAFRDQAALRDKLSDPYAAGPAAFA